MGNKTKPLRMRVAWLLAVLGVLLFYLQATLAQTPVLTVSNGIAGLSWPQTAYYYLLQSTTNLTARNSWFNVATAHLCLRTIPFPFPRKLGQLHRLGLSPTLSRVILSLLKQWAMPNNFSVCERRKIRLVFRFAALRFFMTVNWSSAMHHR
jgi:hypothetical protein